MLSGGKELSGKTAWNKHTKEDEGQLILSRNSYVVLRAIQVTPDVDGGVAFLINDNSSLPDNSQGWWLGMVNANTNGSSQASVAVEFDTRKSDEQDIEGNHIGLNINRIQSAKQVSLSNYDVYISAGARLLAATSPCMATFACLAWELNSTDFNGMSHCCSLFGKYYCSFQLSTYLPQKIFMGFFGSTSNETELNCVKSWAFSDADIGGNGNQLWVWIMVPVASVGGNTDKLAIRFQEGRAAEGDGPVNGLPKVDRGESVQSRTGAKRRKSGSVKRFKQDPASSGPNLTQNATNVHVGYAITDAEMEIVNLGLAADSSSHRFSASVLANTQDVSVTFLAIRSDGKEVMVDNQYLKANNPLLLISFYEQHLKYSPPS
ncbi:hypothetical protein GOBAR_DD17699 [Gossypium barbadense]|nr:hypothetical protein GOBAR_DD17699 [Gossypium barbadense]